MQIKDFGRSIVCAACAGVLAVGGYVFKNDADALSKGMDKLHDADIAKVSGYDGIIRVQYLLAITIDRTFEYSCFGSSALTGLIGIVSLPFRRKKLEDKIEE